MTCGSDDWLCEALQRVGLRGFAARTAEFLLVHPLKVGVVLLLAVFLSRLGDRIARRSVASLVSRSPLREPSERSAQRATTLGGVLASVVRITVWTLAVLVALEEVGFNLGPLLAGASIVGVAVGFGAQSLVRDFLSGFFILMEDQYGLGDEITVAEVSGLVEEVNLRVTRLRASDGTVWFVPNGEIRKVGNSAKGWSTAVVDIAAPATVDLAALTAAVAAEAESLVGHEAYADVVLAPPEVLGVEAMGLDSVTLRVSVRTRPDQRSRVARELRARIFGRLRRDGIIAG